MLLSFRVATESVDNFMRLLFAAWKRSRLPLAHDGGQTLHRELEQLWPWTKRCPAGRASSWTRGDVARG